MVSKANDGIRNRLCHSTLQRTRFGCEGGLCHRAGSSCYRDRSGRWTGMLFRSPREEQEPIEVNIFTPFKVLPDGGFSPGFSPLFSTFPYSAH